MFQLRPGDRVRRRSLAPLLWLALTLAVCACQADVDVHVTVEEDGSGVVETTAALDQEAADRLLDLDLNSAGLPLTDLAQAGWLIDRPQRDAGGGIVITASKDFGTPEQFGEVMAELTGEAGMLRGFELERRKSFARVDYTVEGTIDTTGGLEAFGDPELEASLDRSLTEIAQRYDASADDFELALEIALPGEAQGEVPSGLLDTNSDDLRARWTASLGDADVTPVAFSSATRTVSALVLRGVAIVAGVLAALVVFAQLLRILLLPDRRRRRAAKKRKAAREAKSRPKPEPPPQPAPETEAGEAGSGVAEPAVPHRVVALDGMGVLYREGDDVNQLLIPFARQRGSAVPTEDITAKVRALSLGRITTGEFWNAIGVAGDPAQLDTEYLALHQLSPGVVKYLRALRDRGIRVACITNDAAAWAAMLRARHSLDSLIDPWVVSGSVGVRKPDKPLFEVLRRVTGEPPSSILVIDDNLECLDAARELGFATAWFTRAGDVTEARNHTIIRNFNVQEEAGSASST